MTNKINRDIIHPELNIKAMKRQSSICFARERA